MTYNSSHVLLLSDEGGVTYAKICGESKISLVDYRDASANDARVSSHIVKCDVFYVYVMNVCCHLSHVLL